MRVNATWKLQNNFYDFKATNDTLSSVITFIR